MRKLILIMLAFVPLTLFAQEWSFGVDAGVSRNTFTSNAESILPKSQIGFTGGGFVNYTSKVGLVYGTGLYFNTSKGGSFYVNDIDNSQYLMKGVERIEASYSSFELPLNFGYRLKLGEKFSITPKVGAWVAVNVGGKMNVYTQDIDGTKKVYEDYSPFKLMDYEYDGQTFKLHQFRSVDAGLSAGAKFEYSKLFFNFSANFGLTNVRTDIRSNGTYGQENCTMKSQSFTFTLGYKF